MKIDEENAERSELATGRVRPIGGPDWHLTSNAQRPIKRRTAVDLGRRITNATVSTILSFVVTAAAQYRTVVADRPLRRAMLVKSASPTSTNIELAT